MKPNFALRLSHDGVEVLHRSPAGWESVGSARFDDTNLESTLARLRTAAEGRGNGTIRSKLILPASELRYETVLAPGPTDEARRLQIEAEIEGLTPYAVNELAFDWVVEGDHALVAIAAREIMAEAEAFARDHGFNPVSVVAQPAPGQFAGEPFFGETGMVRSLVMPGDRVERDAEPVRIAPPAARTAPPVAPPVAPKARTAQATALPTAPVTPAAPAAPSPAGASAPASAPAGVSTPTSTPARNAERPAAPPQAPVAPPAAPKVAAPVLPGPAARVAATVQSAAPEALSKVGDLVRRMGTRIRREQVVASAAPKDPAKAVTGVPVTAPKPATADSTAATRFRPAAASAATGAAATTRAVPPADSAEPRPKPPLPAANGGTPATTKPATDAAPVAFASRRRTDPSRPSSPVLVSSGAGTDSAAPGPGGRIAMVPGKNDAREPGLLTRVYRGGRRRAKALLARVGLAQAPQGRKARRKAEGRTETTRPQVPEPIVPASRPPASEREKASEAAALTIFGARNAPPAASGFARRGLMLTGGLILLLVAVGIWAVYFASSPAPTPQIASDEPAVQDVAALPGIAAPAPLAEPEAAPETTPPAPLAEPATTPTEPAASEPPLDAPVETAAVPEPAAEPAPDPAAMLEELVRQGLSEALPAEIFDQPLAIPGEDMAASPVESQPEPRLTPDDASAAETGTDLAGDLPLDVSRALTLALPRPLEVPQTAEVAPVSPPPPPPFGAEFTLGDDGLVEATPEGALTPSGVTVFARSPAVVPPRRPSGLAPEPATPEPATPEPAPAETASPEPAPSAPAPGQVAAAPSEAAIPADETAPEVVFDDTPRADPALAGLRPPPRSARVAAIGAAQSAAEPAPSESAPAVQSDDGPPAEREDGASLAPTPPPGGVSLAGLRPQQRPTDLVAPAALAETEPLAEGTPEAVATSLRPSARPDDLSARIQQMLAAARPQEPAQPAAAAAAAAPAAAGPVAAAAAPQIPTSASVAEQATQARAINLRDVNLIGVFGTPSERRALVRLGNGRVVRVQVGDQLDGGRVSAIGDDELRYVRNGRNEVLRIGQRG